MDPRSASASILQRGAGQRGRHGAPRADAGRWVGAGDGEGRESPSTAEAPERGDAGASPAAVTPGDGEPAGPARVRGGEGKGPGREEGAGRRPARRESGRAQSLAPSGRGPGRPGAGKGVPGLSPASPGRPWRPRPLHRPAGAATARAAGPRSLQQPRTPRAEPETLLLLPLLLLLLLLLLLPAARSRRSPGPPPSRVRVAPGGQDRARPPGDASALNGDGGSPNRHTVRGGGGAAPPATPRPSLGRASSPPPTARGRWPLPPRAGHHGNCSFQRPSRTRGAAPGSPGMEGREGGNGATSEDPGVRPGSGQPCAEGKLVLRRRPSLHPPGGSKGAASACTARFFKSCVTPTR